MRRIVATVVCACLIVMMIAVPVLGALTKTQATEVMPWTKLTDTADAAGIKESSEFDCSLCYSAALHIYACLAETTAHDGCEVIVHRKGATPAATGVRGIIPGSMASPGFIVQGKGERKSLCSASHGAGRRMSRNAARQQFSWNDARSLIDAAGVTVISAGVDEVPMVYKDIMDVMAAQKDLVEILARFDPKIVKMAPAGERAED